MTITPAYPMTTRAPSTTSSSPTTTTTTTTTTPTTTSSSSSFWTAYERFLLGNASRIATIESTLRTATYFLPGRFADAELAGEAVYAFLNLLGLYHDSILYRALVNRSKNESAGRQKPTATPMPSRRTDHNRYVSYLLKTVPGYPTLAKSLALISSLEILIEMVAVRRWGKQGRWRIVLWLESLKAALRLVLMKATNTRLLIRPTLPDREIDPNELQGLALVAEEPVGMNGPVLPRSNGVMNGDSHHQSEKAALEQSSHDSSWRATSPRSSRPRTSSQRPTLASMAPPAPSSAPFGAPIPSLRASDVSSFLNAKALSTEDILRPGQLVHRISGLGKAAELLWILRPLLYVAMIRKYGPRHIYPFALSLTLELLSRRLYKQYRQLQQGLGGSKGPSLSELANDPMMAILAGLNNTSESKNLETTLEKEEMSKRSRALWLNLLRGPVWETWTKKRIEGLVASLEGKPILGLVGSIARDYLPLYDNYYYYSAGA